MHLVIGMFETGFIVSITYLVMTYAPTALLGTFPLLAIDANQYQNIDWYLYDSPLRLVAIEAAGKPLGCWIKHVVVEGEDLRM